MSEHRCMLNKMNKIEELRVAFSLLSDELDAQIFYPKENIGLFLALYVLKYSYG